ncbi:hypothetical protein CASFOL_003586 [Castilleja foliolosa]|uniref:PIN-like protein n=1 Tax=Castilleja foliolosa TaxID=1961234 RepID=A0ABD3ELC3_9LAMI
MFQVEQCEAINRFTCFFILPFFTFHFTSGVDPYHMTFRFLAGEVIAKAVVGVSLALWACLWKNGNLSWAITSFSLWSLNNTLVVGVPLMQGMYGPEGVDLVVQSSVIQALMWYPALLFLLELRRSIPDHSSRATSWTDVRSIMITVGAKLAKNLNCYACVLGLIWALISKSAQITLLE